MTAKSQPDDRDDLFRPEVPVDWDGLRRVFKEADYCLDTLTDVAQASRPQTGWSVTLALHRMDASPRLQTLARLFLFGLETTRAEAEAALGAALTAQLLAARVLLPSGGNGLRAEGAILAYQDNLIAHDFSPLLTLQEPGKDHVLGVGEATMMLDSITPRLPVRRALDVGTGSGYQALLAARHASAVVGTDVNPRALAFARLSLRMNGIRNVELREGSFFDPAGAEPYDLIVSNPPFVISPERLYVYRDSELQGNRMAEFMIRESAARLDEGGFAAILLSWTHETADDWARLLPSWVRDTGCDALQLKFSTLSPPDYTATWLADTHRRDPREAERKIGEWLAHFQALGVRNISWGGVILRKRAAGRKWTRSHVVSQDSSTGPRGDQVLRIFRNVDLLENLTDDAALLEIPLVLAPEHALVYSMEAERGPDGLGGGWKLLRARLHLTRGLAFASNTDSNAASVLAACDGKRPLRAVVEEFAKKTGAPASALAPSVVAALKPLLEGGFIMPGSARPS